MVYLSLANVQYNPDRVSRTDLEHIRQEHTGEEKDAEIDELTSTSERKLGSKKKPTERRK